MTYTLTELLRVCETAFARPHAADSLNHAFRCNFLPHPYVYLIMMDEVQVITSVQRGNADSYADLVERYWVGLVIYCERLVGDRMEAEDIAQKSFIKAYEKLHTFNSEKGRFSTWLYKIASNEAVDFLRKNRKVIPQDAVEDVEPVMPDFLSEELLQDVRKAVLDLVPPEHRRAVEAYYWEGKNCQAIANEMHVPLNTVKSWLRRAKLQLRRALA
jgi:RNA polymerase sigma-70 factor (ECF subfamily)